MTGKIPNNRTAAGVAGPLQKRRIGGRRGRIRHPHRVEYLTNRVGGLSAAEIATHVSGGGEIVLPAKVRNCRRDHARSLAATGPIDLPVDQRQIDRRRTLRHRRGVQSHGGRIASADARDCKQKQRGNQRSAWAAASAECRWLTVWHRRHLTVEDFPPHFGHRQGLQGPASSLFRWWQTDETWTWKRSAIARSDDPPTRIACRILRISDLLKRGRRLGGLGESFWTHVHAAWTETPYRRAAAA